MARNANLWQRDAHDRFDTFVTKVPSTTENFAVCGRSLDSHSDAMLFRRRLSSARALLALFVLAPVSRGAEAPLSRYATVEIESVKTSIYVGSVTMTMPPLVRKDGAFSSTYNARVFPYFFSSEKGTLSINFSDDELRRLERGETVQFTGRAVNTDGEERRIEGRAVPDNATSGKIKVRVFVSKKIELIFNTKYRFKPL